MMMLDLGDTPELSFNRYMVECKYSIRNTVLSYNIVLIDTWWNVNKSCAYNSSNCASVLIDTWWNVNMLLFVRL